MKMHITEKLMATWFFIIGIIYILVGVFFTYFLMTAANPLASMPGFNIFSGVNIVIIAVSFTMGTLSLFISYGLTTPEED